MIPARLIRTIPTVASDEAEGFWRGACGLHPHWDYTTWRDPVDRDKFPLTSPHWAACKSGAQMAGLIRLEPYRFVKCSTSITLDSLNRYRPTF